MRNAWLVGDERVASLRQVERFLTPGRELPELVMANGVHVVGFFDEIEVRQTRGFVSELLTFWGLGERQCVTFVWLPYGNLDLDSWQKSLIYRAELGGDDIKSFVDWHREPDLEAFSSPVWLIIADNQDWAIYGEHYRSEMAVMLCLDATLVPQLRGAFSGLMTDAGVASDMTGNPTPSAGSEAFKHELIRNYQSLIDDASRKSLDKGGDKGGGGS